MSVSGRTWEVCWLMPLHWFDLLIGWKGKGDYPRSDLCGARMRSPRMFKDWVHFCHRFFCTWWGLGILYFPVGVTWQSSAWPTPTRESNNSRQSALILDYWSKGLKTFWDPSTLNRRIYSETFRQRSKIPGGVVLLPYRGSDSLVSSG